MTCEYDFCIYNRDLACLHDQIELDMLGMCACCILPTIPAEELEAHKRRTREKLDKNWE